MEKLVYHNVVKIHECIETNSTPLRVECEDGNLYIIKTIFGISPPLVDVINEVLCNYFLQLWNIPVAEQALFKLEKVVLDSFVKEGKFIADCYKKFNPESLCFFGVKLLSNTIELERFNLSIDNKRDFNKYTNPLDFIKIAVFDKWVGNMDRRKGNANLLLIAEELYKFVPIDHTQAFAYQGNYKTLNIHIMDRAADNSIMLLPMFKSICKFADPKVLKKLSEEILTDIQNTLVNIDFIFSNIPTEFGLSKKGKQKINDILSDKDRNNRIATLYLNYCK